MFGSPRPGLKPAQKRDLRRFCRGTRKAVEGPACLPLPRCSNHLAIDPVVVTDPPGASRWEAAPSGRMGGGLSWKAGAGGGRCPAPAAVPARGVQIWAQHRKPGGFLGYQPQPGPNGLYGGIPLV